MSLPRDDQPDMHVCVCVCARGFKAHGLIYHHQPDVAGLWKQLVADQLFNRQLSAIDWRCVFWSRNQVTFKLPDEAYKGICFRAEINAGRNYTLNLKTQLGSVRVEAHFVRLIVKAS